MIGPKAATRGNILDGETRKQPTKKMAGAVVLTKVRERAMASQSSPVGQFRQNEAVERLQGIQGEMGNE